MRKETAPDSLPVADEDESLASAWRERAIDLRRLSWPLRLVIAATILATGVASALIIIRDVPQSHILIDTTSTTLAAPIPTSAFVAALVLWVAAWSLALTGAIFGHWALRLLVVITFIFISLVGVIIERSVLIVAVPLLIIALWILAASMARWLVGRRGRSLPRWLPLVSFVVVLAALSSHYAILLYLDKQVGPSTAIFPQFVELEFEAYAFVLIPVLFLTGSDFGEWAEIAAGQVNDWLKRARSTWVLLIVSVLVAAGILIARLLQRGTFAPFDLASALDLVSVALFGLVTALIFLFIGRLGRIATWPRVALPAWALVLATVTFMFLQTGPAYVLYFVGSIAPPSPANSVDYSVFHHSAQTYSSAFSLAYPSDWKNVVNEPQKAGDGLVVLFLGTTEPGMQQFWLAEFPTASLNGEDQYSIEQDVVTGVCQEPSCHADLVQVPSHGSWYTVQTLVQDQDTHGNPVQLKGMVWERTQGDSTWVLYGAAEPDEFKAALPIYTAMLDSWKPNLEAVVPASPTDRLDNFLSNLDPTSILSFALLPLAVTILVGIPLLLRGKRRPGPLAVAGLFLTAYGLREGLLFFPKILAYFGVPTSKVVLLTLNQNEQLTLSGIPTLNLPVLQITVALFTLLLVVWLVVRRAVNSRAARDILAIALVLNTSLLGIQLLDIVFSTTDQIALRLTEAQGVLLILAFLWDLLTSGKQVTNTEGCNSPRSARVLLYAGLSLLSCSQVLFFTTLGGSAGQNFSGDWSDIGLTALGVPALITLIMLRFARVGQQQAIPPEEPVGAPVGEPSQTLPDSHLPGIYDAH
jgi:hypothetical protein